MANAVQDRAAGASRIAHAPISEHVLVFMGLCRMPRSAHTLLDIAPLPPRLHACMRGDVRHAHSGPSLGSAGAAQGAFRLGVFSSASSRTVAIVLPLLEAAAAAADGPGAPLFGDSRLVQAPPWPAHANAGQAIAGAWARCAYRCGCVGFCHVRWLRCRSGPASRVTATFQPGASMHRYQGYLPFESQVKQRLQP